MSTNKEKRKIGIFDLIKLKISLAKYTKFFNNTSKFYILEPITETVDKKITEIYHTLVEYDSNKYSKEIQMYSDYMDKIKEHNSIVNNINNELIGFNFNYFIISPTINNYEIINHYLLIINKINSFKIKNDKYIRFSNEVNELNKNYKYIIEQYNLIDLYKSIFNREIDSYIDITDKNRMIEKLKPLSDNIRICGKKYYDFHYIDNIDEFIKTSNDKYIYDNLHDNIFDNVNGKSLDKEQRISILSDEKSALTIAGAGSGKTLTICGKVKFLIEKLGISPDDILLLSYSKKSADDLAEKVMHINDNLTVNTFHKLGLDILKDVENKKYVVEEQFNAIIEKYFREEIASRANMMHKVLNYIALYMSPNNHNKKYDNDGEMYQDLKRQDFKTLKELSNNIDKKETIKKEVVKSFEEMAIANFYFINGIDYIYEQPYKVDVSTTDRRQYTPDFYLNKYNIYHEHFGIDINGKANQYTAEVAREYEAGIVWKRNVHAANNSICIETYSYEFQNDTVFQKLKKTLSDKGVELKPLSTKQIFNSLKSIYEGKSFKSFINLIKSFLSLYKSRYSDDSYFDKLKQRKFTNNYEKTRTSYFLDIVKDVYQYYMSTIRLNDKIDFDDMILQSSKVISKSDKFKYKYIIVDEFQDISYSRMIFLKKIIENGNAKLYAVGDDWQAIYRFTGCDLNIFTHFDDYFGYSKKSYITSTYRNSQELQDIAGPFIKKNPEQFDKIIKSNKHLAKPINIMYYTDDKISALYEIFDIIYKLNSKASVLLLGRNNKDIEDIYSTRLYMDNGKIICKDYPSFELKFSTVHSSKGLEDDFVVIINADDDRLGFPNMVEDDELLNLVLSVKSNFEFAEERRIWYVALTRTKSYTYILSSYNNPSIFVKEIEKSCNVINQKQISNIPKATMCPHCKSGRLIVRCNEINKKSFYGCSNYPYCNYTINDMKAVANNKRCPICNNFMVYRRGPYGSFYGCNSFPRCKYKENIQK